MAASGDAGVPRGPAFCTQSRAEPLLARLGAIGAGADAGAAAAAAPTWFVGDLYQQFDTFCGRCHGELQALGNPPFQIKNTADFDTYMTGDVLTHIQSNGGPSDPEPMPPEESGWIPYSQGPPTDPLKQFAELVAQWITLQKPPSFSYALPGASDSSAAENTTPIPNASIGNAMTNIGNCIPSPGLVGLGHDQMAKLDAMFAAAKAVPVADGGTQQQAIGLPQKLSDTDLTTLDSATLAMHSVIAYAPNYPLWSDNAGKLRYVRVPLGTSIAFDKASQSFTIPANTRFYKTFMKQIVDQDGSLRYRKIETRLIVSRPDRLNSDGSYTPTALFGTYKWSDDESSAALETLPLNDQEPFPDDFIQYDTDEPLANDLLGGQPSDPEGTLLNDGAARHYAIPSSQRCMQCHEGSESHSFVLGFLPLQINRRPTGLGGTIEATGPDELSQMQRFIDYGLVTGMTSTADVLPLEQAEGSRPPRNDHELVAQGYMLGNCAHCHNPEGFPSLQNPVLAPILNFYPGPTSGIFQFPLEQTSPRIFRGPSSNEPIPYITPSLVDLPRSTPAEFVTLGADPGGNTAVSVAWYAPWRSLIYRNTDSPFSYTDDSALFPHMPLNTPGYDGRAHQILSDWMVSIPAVRKRTDLNEYAFDDGQGHVYFGAAVDTNPQPYVEVAPGDPRYADAVVAADQRLEVLHSGFNPNVPLAEGAGISSRYAEPADPNDDIIDPSIGDNVCNPVPQPHPTPVANNAIQSPVPSHCEWVITDTTQPPGAWSPRQASWGNVLVEGQSTQLSSCGGAAEEAKLESETAVSLLQTITLDPVRTYLTTPVPFGLWQVKTGCNFAAQPPTVSQPVSQIAGPNQPLWLSYLQGSNNRSNIAPPPPDAPVYMSSPGEAVYKMICINCHGPIGDATGRLATNLATMTGGLALVADFRDGLFGPLTNPGQNLAGPTAFGTLHDASGTTIANPPPSWTSASPEDRAARYMPWMALGGTAVTIPQALLGLVTQTPVLGLHRALPPEVRSANMLSTAKSLCDDVLGTASNDIPVAQTGVNGYAESFIQANGDGELWMRLCSLNNPSPIHVVQVQGTTLTAPIAIDGTGAFTGGPRSLLDPKKFPPGTPVGNERGQIVPYDPGTSPDGGAGDPNIWPWCVDNLTGHAPPGLPACPQSLQTVDNSFTADEAQAWSVQGAINTGLGVFLYLEGLEKLSAPPPDYDECESLPP